MPTMEPNMGMKVPLPFDTSTIAPKTLWLMILAYLPQEEQGYLKSIMCIHDKDGNIVLVPDLCHSGCALMAGLTVIKNIVGFWRRGDGTGLTLPWLSTLLCLSSLAPSSFIV